MFGKDEVSTNAKITPCVLREAAAVSGISLNFTVKWIRRKLKQALMYSSCTTKSSKSRWKTSGTNRGGTLRTARLTVSSYRAS